MLSINNSNYYSPRKTSFDHNKIPHVENVNHPRYNNHFYELKYQMMRQKETEQDKKIKNKLEDREIMRRTQLLNEREKLENLQRKKIQNEILLQTNIRIHNEKKEKEVVSVCIDHF